MDFKRLIICVAFLSAIALIIPCSLWGAQLPEWVNKVDSISVHNLRRETIKVPIAATTTVAQVKQWLATRPDQQQELYFEQTWLWGWLKWQVRLDDTVSIKQLISTEKSNQFYIKQG